jgi:hydroxyacylglutathione hydrolase
MSMKVKRFLTSVNVANCYICWCDETSEGVIIDPAEFTTPMLQWLNDHGLKLSAILITHGHYDHDSGIDSVTKNFDVPVMAAKQYPKGKLLKENDLIEFGNCNLQVVATPGHTDDSISLLGDSVAFVGDAIFAAAVGGTTDRQHFSQEVAAINEHLFSLPPMTRLLPGHGPASTVAVERAYNPFFLD